MPFFVAAILCALVAAAPLPARAMSDEFPAGTNTVPLPARFVDGDIIVQAGVAGRELDFVLDSGSNTIVLDAGIARELGFARDAAGAVDIPEMTLGALTLRDVPADAIPLQYRARDRTAIAGVLGYDFLASIVVHVDYRDARVFAIAPETFTGTIAGAANVPIALDDGLPMVSAKVGGSESDRFIVDSGADDVYLFDGFARSHQADVTDRAGAAAMVSSLPFLARNGAPATMPLMAVDVDDFTFADVDFRHFLAYRVTATDAGDIAADGLIGYRFLRYYDVYFDYPESRLIMLPNDLVPHAGPP